jgi:hypothetical protein
LFQEYKQKIIAAGLNSIDKLEELKAQEQNKHEEKTRQEPQLFVFSSEILAPANTP